MSNEPITHIILQTAKGFYRREIVAGMAVALTPASLKITDDGGTFTYPRADAAPVATPVATVPATPIAPVVKRPVTLMVGPNQQFKHYTTAMSSLFAEMAKGPIAVDVQLEVPTDPAYYLGDVSSHYRQAQGFDLDWPPFEQIIPCDTTIRPIPGSKGLVPFPVAPASMYYGKAPFILGAFVPGSSGRVVIEGLKVSGAKRGDVDGNIAAFRMEGVDPKDPRGDITIRDCEIFDCDDGFLGGSAGQTLTMERVYLHDCGSGSGYTHNIYAGAFDQVTFTDVLSVNARVGHLLKCRSAKVTLRRVRLFDGPNGTASYCLDLPNGGVVDIDGLVTHKGAKASNIPVFCFGEEGDANGGQHPDRVIKVRNWTALSDRADALLLWNAAGAATDISGTKIRGLTPGMRTGLYGATVDGPFPDTALQMLGAAAALDMSSPVRANV